MSNHNPPNQFDSERAAEAGKKGKRKGIEQQVQEFLDEKWKDGEEKTRLQLIYEALLKYGLKGNVRALETLMDRGFGKPKQTIEQTGEMTNILSFEKVAAKDKE